MSKEKITRNFHVPNAPLVVKANAVDATTGKEYAVEQHDGSYCLDFKIEVEKYDLKFRFDYNKISKNGDPTLDLQIYQKFNQQEVNRTGSLRNRH